MQTTLFQPAEQYVATRVSVAPEHAECERIGFVWQPQARFGGGEDVTCSRCGTRRPYDVRRTA